MLASMIKLRIIKKMFIYEEYMFTEINFFAALSQKRIISSLLTLHRTSFEQARIAPDHHMFHDFPLLHDKYVFVHIHHTLALVHHTCCKIHLLPSVHCFSGMDSKVFGSNYDDLLSNLLFKTNIKNHLIVCTHKSQHTNTPTEKGSLYINLLK